MKLRNPPALKANEIWIKRGSGNSSNNNGPVGRKRRPSKVLAQAMALQAAHYRSLKGMEFDGFNRLRPKGSRLFGGQNNG